MNKIFPLKTSALRNQTVWLLAVLCWLGFGTSAWAQVSAYTFAQSGGTYTPITGGTVYGNTTSDDQSFVDPVSPLGAGGGPSGVGIPIGFNFTFNGVVFDRIGINNNGWIAFGQSSLGASAVNTNTSSNYTAISATSTAPVLLQHRVAGFSTDLVADADASLRVQTIGTAPNRVLVVQWSSYARYSFPQLAENINFQIRLNETTNVVDIVYGSITVDAASTASTITTQVGLRGHNNVDFNNRSTATDWNAAIAGTVNTASCTSSNTAVYPVSGLTFTYTPNVCSAPIITSFTPLNTLVAVNWNPVANATSGYNIQYRVGTSGPFTPFVGNPVAFGTNTATITGLTASTSYEVQIQSDCAPAGVFSASYTFSTVANPVAPSFAYTCAQTLGTYTEITSGAVLGTTANNAQVFNNSTTGQAATATSTGFDIGFPFTYRGLTLDKFAVATDGFIVLGTGTFSIGAVTTTPLSTSSANYSNALSVFAVNMEGQTGSELSYATIGTAPNRTLVVQWKNYRRAGATGENLNMQIRLNEADNSVEYVYGTFVSTALTSTTFQVGLRGVGTGTTVFTDVLNRVLQQGWAATTVGTANTSTSGFSQSLAPASGTTLKFLSVSCTMPTTAPALVGVVGLTTATISWNASAVATDGYDVRYRRLMDSFSAYTVVNVPNQLTTSLTLTGLQQGMQYVVEVRNRCSSSTFSEYSPALTIATQNNPLNYVFSQSNTTYTEITGGSVLGGTANDSESFSGTLAGSTSTFSGYGFPIGFPFAFNGNTFERFAVSTNGWIGLGIANGSFQVGNSTSPMASTTPHTAIAGFAADLSGQTGSELSYLLTGTAPNRTLVVQWKNYRRLGVTGESINFQIRLNETSNTVNIVYGNFTLPTATSSVALVGVKTNGTTVHLNTHTRTTFIGAGQSWLNTSTGAANNNAVAYANQSALNTSFPTNGLLYTFTPNNCVPFPTLSAFGATPPDGTLIVNWTPVAGAISGYDIRYRRYTDLPATYNVVNVPSQATNTFNLTGLIAGELYIVEIRSRCSASSFSEYSNASVGVTNCTPISAARNYDFNSFGAPFLPSCWNALVVLGTSTTAAVRTTTSGTPVSGNQLELINGTTANATIRVIAVMPQMSDLGAGQSRRIRFRARTGTAGTVLKVGTITSPTDANTYANIQDITLTTTHTEYVVQFDAYTGGNQYIAFRHGAEITGTNVSVFIDDVVWEVIPPCGAPTGITASGITTNSATISWNLGLGDFAGYELQYRTGAGAWTTVTLGAGVLTTNLTSLLANTSYEVQIRTMCNALQSSYSSIFTFVTPCASVPLPYFEGFEGVAVAGAQIPCHVRNGDWTTQIGAQSQGRIARTGTKYAHTSWSTITGGDMYYFAPVTLTGGATYKASIWYNTGNTIVGWTEFSMLYGTTQTDAGLINIASAPVDVDGNIITTGYQELTGTFTPATTGVYYVALRVVGSFDPWYFMVDDFLLDQLFAIDMKPVSLVTPANVGCLNSATQSVVVKVQNEGTSAINFAANNLTVTTNVTGAATATLTGTVNTGTLASGATLDVTMTGTLNMSVAGAYNFSITSNLTGDLNAPNNTASVGSRTNVAPVALPQNVNFTGFDGNNITNLFPNWYEATGLTSPTPAANFVGWSSFTNTTASPNLGADGNVLARINYYSFSQGQNWFVGPKFTATTTSTIKFSTAATQWNTATNAVTIGDDDGVQVMVSTDCGLTWTVASSFLGNANINNTLTEKTFSLGAYNGQQIIVAVRGTTGATVDADPDYWLWLDNIRVYDAAPIDMTALELVSPVNAGCYGANQTVTVKVKNLGALPMNFATNPTTVTVNVTGAVTQTLTTTLNTGTLAVDATQDVVVSSTFGMTAFGVYTFNANTNVTVGVDGDATNNAMLATTRNRVAPLTIPLPVANFTGYTDVEDNLDPTATNLTTIHPGWAEGQGTTTPTGTTSLWKSRTGLGSGTNTTTAFNFWSVRSAWLMTPKFTATPNGEIVYKTAITGWNNFNAYALGMDNDDVLDVLVSTDCGVTWTVVKSYNQTNTNTLTNVLVEDFVNLSAYNGQDVIVAFRASSTASGNDYDFHLDDIAIKNCVPPSITTQPSALAAICAGTPTSSYAVAAAGDGLAYQWQADTGSGFTNVTDGINYNGATTITLNILNAPATFNAYKYRVVVTGRCGSINSSENTLTVNTTPVITTEAQNKTACEGTNTSMTVDGTSFVAPTFKWQMRTSPTGAFADLVADAVHTNTTTATLNFTNVPFSHNGYQYRCVINNTCGNTFSSPATLTVTRKPIITVQPVSQGGCANENYTFSVTATSDAGNLTYQWQEDEGEGAGFVNLANDATFSGVATATLTITNIGSIFDGDKYRCIVTNDCGSTNTDGLAMYNWVDTQAPVFAAYNNITFNASAGNTANCGQAVTFATPTATDNCANTPFTITRTAGLASGSNFPVGVTTMTYTATDAKNNVATLNFTITVVDDVNPALVGCPANITVNNTVGLNSAVVNYTAPTATDNCAGVTVARTTGLASGSTFPLGITTITHEASDVAGNKVSCTFTVTVNFVNAAPTFTATNPATVLEDAGAQSIANWAIGNDNDEAVQTLTYEVDQIQTTTLFSVAPAISANGTLTYTPALNANGSSTFRVRLKDSGGVANGGVDVSAYQTFTINVTAVNDKPTIGVPTYNLEQVAGTDLAVEVSGITAGGGTDEANQTFSITNIVAITGANVVELPALPITITAGKANFNIKLVAAGEAQIRLTVRDNGGVLNGGVDTEERVFTIKAISQEQVFVPEMFSPNNDKDNDFLRVKAAKGIVQTIKLEVFDAQGNRVFYSDLVDRVVDTGWDGNNENGKPQPQGNYTWRLSGKFKDGRDIKATDGKNNNINRGNVFLFRGSN